ncbi:MAG: helix-turn-helix domain-containing protein [Dorea sp.]|uniref:helix-turn-helix domain-containing protein n=1 Tax=Dorea sp. TaxID=2040332 RepID=UPI003992FBC2
MLSYNPLWKTLIDKNMKKMDLKELAGISNTTLAKLGKNGHVSTEIIYKICEALNCGIGDVIEIVHPEEE